MILVRKTGAFTSIQDLGREGYRRYGIPPGGALDRAAAQLANRLVGNGAHAPLLEITATGPLLEFQANMRIALTGADLQARLNEFPAPYGRSFLVCSGDLLQFGSARRGYRAYLAVAGGLLAQKHWGSCSTYLPAKWGGLRGQTLQKGDLLQPATPLNPSPQDFFGTAQKPQTNGLISLPCLPGPEWGMFSPDSQKDFLCQTFSVHPQSNRMAVRFREKWLAHNIPNKLLSSPVLPGTLQLTHGGELLLIMHDGPTTGGYPRLLNLTEDGLKQAAQLPPGQKIVFSLAKDLKKEGPLKV